MLNVYIYFNHKNCQIKMRLIYRSLLRREVLNIQRRCGLYTGAANKWVYTVIILISFSIEDQQRDVSQMNFYEEHVYANSKLEQKTSLVKFYERKPKEITPYEIMIVDTKNVPESSDCYFIKPFN